MKMFRKILDERQELEAMRVERGTCWFFFFGLMAAMIVQMFFFGDDFARTAGELVVFVVGCTWMTVGYIRRGIWSYFSTPGMKSYILYSIAVGVIFGPIPPLMRYFREDAPFSNCLRSFAIDFIVIFILSFILMLLFGAVTKARQRKLQKKYDNDNAS